MNFPSPVGGVALPCDFAPSVLFAVLYGLLVPLVAFRIFGQRSRTTLLIGTISFSIERIVIFGLRAAQSRNPSMRMSNGLATYMQVSFGLGFIGLANDLVNLLRCLIVNPTYGPERYPESSAAATKQCYMPPPVEGVDADRPLERFWVRRLSDFAGLAFLAATVPGIIANSHYSKTFENAKDAHRTYVYRYVSSGVALFLMIMIILVATWSLFKQPRAGQRGVLVISILASLTGTIAIYRLSVMLTNTTALDSMAPGSLNLPKDKALFYVFHVLPEWLASAILVGLNIRKTFGTGLSGDWRFRDETPKEKARREKMLANRAERKAKRAEKKQAQEKELVSIV